MNRSQKVKVDGCFSELLSILLGFPQGSLLGPLFFIIFINDLPFLLEKLYSMLYADDTTLLMQGNDLYGLIDEFKKQLKPFTDWCSFNRLDVNWDKTFFMFVTTKRIKAPEAIEIDGKLVKVVDQFKLLGVTIDKKLNFLNYASILKNSVIKKLYSIKRLFYLSFNVKLQFFKTFIAPHFDFCSTIYLYFPKATLYKIFNCYNYCISKLLGIKADQEMLNEKCGHKYCRGNCLNFFNIHLESYGLCNFQHRLFLRATTFVHNIINKTNAPRILKEQIVFKKDINNHYSLRSNNQVMQQLILKNHYGESTFIYLFSKLINNFILNDLELKFSFFVNRMFNNVNKHFHDFLKIFPKLDLRYKT